MKLFLSLLLLLLSYQTANADSLVTLDQRYWRTNCFITPEKKVHCVGDRAHQYDFSKLHNVQSLVAGEEHVCALYDEGKLDCQTHWPLSEISKIPTDVKNVSSVVSSQLHVCALYGKEEKKVTCWGHRYNHRGTRERFEANLDVKKPKLVEVAYRTTTSLDNQLNTCVLQENGEVKCFNPPDYFDSGKVLTVGNYSGNPISIRASSISVSNKHVCVLNRSRKIYCWRFLGYGYIEAQSPDINNTRMIVANKGFFGHDFCAFHTSDGKENITCWNIGLASIESKQLNFETNSADIIKKYGYVFCSKISSPSNTLTCEGLPSLEQGFSMVEDFDVSSDSVCALYAGGNLKCWGENKNSLLLPGEVGRKGIELLYLNGKSVKDSRIRDFNFLDGLEHTYKDEEENKNLVLLLGNEYLSLLKKDIRISDNLLFNTFPNNISSIPFNADSITILIKALKHFLGVHSKLYFSKLSDVLRDKSVSESELIDIILEDKEQILSEIENLKKDRSLPYRGLMAEKIFSYFTQKLSIPTFVPETIHSSLLAIIPYLKPQKAKFISQVVELLEQKKETISLRGAHSILLALAPVIEGTDSKAFTAFKEIYQRERENLSKLYAIHSLEDINPNLDVFSILSHLLNLSLKDIQHYFNSKEKEELKKIFITFGRYQAQGIDYKEVIRELKDKEDLFVSLQLKMRGNDLIKMTLAIWGYLVGENFKNYTPASQLLLEELEDLFLENNATSFDNLVATREVFFTFMNFLLKGVEELKLDMTAIQKNSLNEIKNIILEIKKDSHSKTIRQLTEDMKYFDKHASLLISYLEKNKDIGHCSSLLDIVYYLRANF